MILFLTFDQLLNCFFFNFLFKLIIEKLSCTLFNFKSSFKIFVIRTGTFKSIWQCRTLQFSCSCSCHLDKYLTHSKQFWFSSFKQFFRERIILWSQHVTSISRFHTCRTTILPGDLVNRFLSYTWQNAHKLTFTCTAVKNIIFLPRHP